MCKIFPGYEPVSSIIGTFSYSFPNCYCYSKCNKIIPPWLNSVSRYCTLLHIYIDHTKTSPLYQLLFLSSKQQNRTPDAQLLAPDAEKNCALCGLMQALPRIGRCFTTALLGLSLFTRMSMPIGG